MATTSSRDQVAHAILEAFFSPNVSDSNLENANIVDVMASIAKALHRLADAAHNAVDHWESLPGGR